MLEGVKLNSLKVIEDDRGAVLRMLRSDSEIFGQFGEVYFSEIYPGKVKAWKRHKLATQNLVVPIGRVRVVIFDDRSQSSTFGKLEHFELGRPDKYRLLTIPPCVWYGFMCIGDTSALIANCTDMIHAPGESERESLDSPLIPYRWC